MSATLRTSVGELAITGESYLLLPGRANWVAVVELASKDTPAVGEQATLAVLPEAKPGAAPATPDTFIGTVRYARAVPGSQTLIVRVVGGKGALFRTLPPADQVGAASPLPAGLVLRGLVDAAGEQLAAGVEQALDAYTLPRWTRIGGMSGRDAIDLLIFDIAQAEGIDLGWRMLPSGTIWAGIETYPAAKGAYIYTSQDPDDGAMSFAPSGAPLRPGTTVLGDRAIEVRYQLSSPAVRAFVRRRVEGDPPYLPAPEARAPYLKSYGAAVELQHDDGTVDVVCDDQRVGELRSVPVRLGVPGCAATMPKGTRVRVRFEGGSPRGAYVADVDQDEDADKPIALVGDGCSYLSGIAPPGGGPVTFAVSSTPTGALGEVQIIVVGPGHKWLKGVSG